MAARKKNTEPTAPKKNSKNRKTTKFKRRLKRLAIMLAILLLSYIVLWIVTPSADEHDAASAVVVAEGLELPALNASDVVVKHTGYTLSYSEEHEQAEWVAYELTKQEVLGNHERQDDFRPDGAIRSGSADVDDYRGSGYDRGHLAPAADFPWSEQAMSDTFYMSNMSPQDPSFNRGIWSSLEAVVRNFAFTKGVVHVATGPVLNEGPFATIGANKVSIPKRFYKVVLDATSPRPVAIGFVIPNSATSKSPSSFAMSVDEVEQITGLDFFVALDDKIEQEAERSLVLRDWDFSQLQVTDQMRSDEAALRKQTIADDPKTSRLRGFINGLMTAMKREIKPLVKTIVPIAFWPAVDKIF